MGLLSSPCSMMQWRRKESSNDPLFMLGYVDSSRFFPPVNSTNYRNDVGGGDDIYGGPWTIEITPSPH